MKLIWKQLLAAFLMGALLPMLCVRIGSLFVAADEPQELPNPTPGDVLEQQYTATVPVLLTETVLTVMNLEEYVCGVVLAEMPVDFSEEALKAQAVAARTCALYCARKAEKHTGGAICTDSTCCQAYIADTVYLADGGKKENVDRVRAAVHATAGQVLTYLGEIIDATYFSCSGGMTEDAMAVWGSDVPYLQSVRSPGEEWAEIFSQSIYYSATEFQELLGRSLIGLPEHWLGDVERTRGGGVATMVLGGKTYTGTQLRQLLGLNSTAFTMTADSGGISISVTGRGHRVGMSQYGAETMTQQGYLYPEILSYYYQGTRIDKLYAVE